jgi:hypothetical protein
MPQMNGLPGQSGVGNWILAAGQLAGTSEVHLPMRQGQQFDRMVYLRNL